MTMKTTIKFLIILGVMGMACSCSQKPVKTIENLKYAYNGESTASAKYAAFAVKAKAEGFDTVSVMFMATSKAEAIHAENHRKVLEKLGEKITGPQIGTFEVLSTAENIADAGKGESGEIDTMYPGFITTAKTEKSPDAIKSFTWALDTEKKHKAFYNTALEALNMGGEKSLPAQWFVCPVCGNTYDLSTVAPSCDFCMTSKDKFLVF
jgi:rubrerythrin